MVAFIQFMFPHGTPGRSEIALEPAVEGLASELRAAGWVFEIECHPRTQVVNADCCDENEQLAQCSELNGELVPPALTKLVQEAWATWVQRGKPQASNPGGGSRNVGQRLLPEWAFIEPNPHLKGQGDAG